VSVVIPCYRYGHYLPQAVASVLDQRGLDVDVLVVDDASPDDSAGVARRLAREDSRVRVLVNEVNLGHIATYNRGLARVSGDYVVLLSADDLLPRDALTRAVALMEHHHRVGLVFGHPTSFESDPPPAAEQVRSWTVWHGLTWLRARAATGRNVILSPEVVMRRAAWDELGGYDARLPHSGDFAAWLDTSLRWDVARVNGATQAFYRVHGDNMHLGFDEGMMLRDLRERAAVFRTVLTEGRPLPPDAGSLQAQARRALALEALRQVRGTALVREDVHDPDPFLDFAARTWPAVVGGRRWRRAQQAARAAGAAPPGPERLLASARASLVFRRWERFGW
jgi:hypothetical protein